jgi:hypothetical protein
LIEQRFGLKRITAMHNGMHSLADRAKA